MADQLRYHALSSSGDPNLTTPHIDRLAAEGMQCTATFSQYPVCVPYRAGLMTGLHAHLNGTLRHGDYLNPSQQTVAHHFAAADYRTSYVGKWHLAPESGANMVTPEGWIGQDFWVHPSFRGGFQDWFGFNISNNYFETYISTGDKVLPLRLEGYQTDALTDLTLSYLAQQPKDSHWFHVISYESPHPGWGGQPRSPLYPVPAAYEVRFEPGDIIVRANVPESSKEVTQVQLAGYYRLISNLDDNVGRILHWLDVSGHTEDTLVVFFSDHGEMGGSHGLRNKQVPYDESLHLPLMWRLPGVLPAGSRYSQPICGLDIYPTSAGLCKLSLPDGLQGLDFSEALRRGDNRPLREAVLVQWEDTRFAFGDHPYRAFRSATHTYVVGRDDTFCLLFDHRADPWELDNRFWLDDRKTFHRQLEQLLVEAREPLPDYMIRRKP
jgi:arylsulfatase A-like enzyme